MLLLPFIFVTLRDSSFSERKRERERERENNEPNRVERSTSVDERRHVVYTLVPSLLANTGWLQIVAVENASDYGSDEDADRTGKQREGEGEGERESERARAQRKDLLEPRMRGYCWGMAKKLLEREKQEERKNLFFLLFFTPGRTARAMRGEQGIEWKINVSILQKKKKKKKKQKKREKRKYRTGFHHSVIFAHIRNWHLYCCSDFRWRGSEMIDGESLPRQKPWQRVAQRTSFVT